ncbi:MAG: chorismate synthase [Omnitrophica bacterium GWA2_41_15]|nr:MAG: chorismate synthase [Omnitrophica bacterium GWA2_41_15]HAZ10268.1 chorismate synthase [Candidatus Omnitrophota bacterium]
MLRFLTAGESHGEALIGILEGMPAGLKIDAGDINKDLKRRQEGYGRGPRMQIEHDRAKMLSGLMRGVTIGSPIAIIIENKDSGIDKLPAVKNPRPGHADLAGILKYGFKDARCVLERASARETAVRVGIGGICKILLADFDINILSRILMIGGVKSEKMIKKKIDEAGKSKDTLGGVFEIIIKGVPPGLGSYAHYDRRLDAGIAEAIMSIPAVKAVEIGNAIESSAMPGSKVHDEIFYSKEKGIYRKINNAGGIEGGMSNGEDIIARGYMKPISTLMDGLNTIDIDTKKQVKASTERSDVCAVPVAGVVGEAILAFVIAKVFLEKFGGDSIAEVKRNYKGYIAGLKM